MHPEDVFPQAVEHARQDGRVPEIFAVGRGQIARDDDEAACLSHRLAEHGPAGEQLWVRANGVVPNGVLFNYPPQFLEEGD